MQQRDLKTYQNVSEISRSCQNFARPTFFEVPFATPSWESLVITWEVSFTEVLHS